ncbi:hypothetical protein EK904_004779 [Melospiza melodia maxima]|nr:hypothetical protein EK904_004779 [Melospiza melodia maxima]
MEEMRAEILGSERRKCRIKCLTQAFPDPLETLTTLAEFCAVQAVGDLGPFNPGLPVEVPVWLAINLKQRQKCRLIPPEWMDVGKLEEIRDQERKEDTFTPMPSPYYMELTKLLLN